MNAEINFTYLNMGLSLCLVCNLGAIIIRGRFRRFWFGVVRGVVSPLKTKEGRGDWRRPSPTNRSRITTQRRESP